MFKNIFAKQKKVNSDNKNILVAALLIHAAKIDENYTEIEKKIIKKALIDLNNISSDQAEELREFHLKTNWDDKYKIALTIRDPRAIFILKRLIFDESPQTLSKEDFKMVHRELHDRLVINQERPFTTISEAMSQIDTEFSNLDNTEDELKAEKIIILKEYNKYLSFPT